MNEHKDLIRASHERSVGFGLDARDRPDFARVARSALQGALHRSQSLVLHAQPVMETLHQQIANTNNIVVLTDAQGLVLHSCGDADFLRRADQVALRPGVEWSERSKGTNAIGTALATGEAAVVLGNEHFLQANHFLSCSCAPVRDPFGNIAGALDITGPHNGFHSHTLALVRMSAQMIENHFFADAFPGAVCVRFHARPEFLGTLLEGIAAFRPDGAFLSANASAQFQLGLGLPALLEQSFATLFGMPLGQLLDQTRRSDPGLPSCRLHNGVAVYLRGELTNAGGAAQASPMPAFCLRRAPSAPCPSEPFGGPSHLHYLDTGDPQVARVLDRVRRTLGKNIPVLVLGETGTGKELLARAIHGDSPRRHGPFVAINCAAIPEGLIESELFGYVEGAFTGGRRRGSQGKIAAADGGTLFLDEIGDMPLALQTRLLRTLDERRVVPLGSAEGVPVDFALVCATHRDLPARIAAGGFREDLYYRINGLVVRLPALRERSDLEIVVRRLLHQEGAGRVALAPEVLQWFARLHWPGNLRQLASVLRTAVQLLDPDANGVIGFEHLPDDLSMGAPADHAAAEHARPDPAVAPRGSERARSRAGMTAPDGPRPASLDQREQDLILQTLQGTGGNISATARILGISRNRVYRRLPARS